VESIQPARILASLVFDLRLSAQVCGLNCFAFAFGFDFAVPCGLLPVPWFLICAYLRKSAA